MNIIELAREAGFFVSTELRDDPSRERFERFAKAVIAAHTEELIEGVGEPAYSIHLCDSCGTAFGDSYYCPKCGEHSATEEPTYTAAQVAGAVLKARKAAYQELLNKDWTEIMREGALVTWGDAETLGDRVVAMILEKQGGATC